MNDGELHKLETYSVINTAKLECSKYKTLLVKRSTVRNVTWGSSTLQCICSALEWRRPQPPTLLGRTEDLATSPGTTTIHLSPTYNTSQDHVSPRTTTNLSSAFRPPDQVIQFSPSSATLLLSYYTLISYDGQTVIYHTFCREGFLSSV